MLGLTVYLTTLRFTSPKAYAEMRHRGTALVGRLPVRRSPTPTEPTLHARAAEPAEPQPEAAGRAG